MADICISVRRSLLVPISGSRFELDKRAVLDQYGFGMWQKSVIRRKKEFHGQRADHHVIAHRYLCDRKAASSMAIFILFM